MVAPLLPPVRLAASNVPAACHARRATIGQAFAFGVIIAARISCFNASMWAMGQILAFFFIVTLQPRRPPSPHPCSGLRAKGEGVEGAGSAGNESRLLGPLASLLGVCVCGARPSGRPAGKCGV